MPIRRNDPYAGFNFRVEIDGAVAGGFAEVSGLSLSVAVIQYREGTDRTNNLRKLPGLNKVEDITLKRGLIGTDELYQWLQAMAQGQQAFRNVSIILMAEDGSGPVMQWLLRRAFPVKLTHGPLHAAGSHVAMEELTLTAEHLEIA